MTKSKQLFAALFLLLVFLSASAQTELPEVQAKLAGYTTVQPSEKLFVHTDKNAYIAGDVIWFKLYAADGINNMPLVLSKVAYVELLDKEGKPVARAKIGMMENGGNGSVQLPFNLPSGYYLLRAYTNAMKNSGEPVFFEKQFAIINTLVSPQAKAEKAQPRFSVHLFPEGGNLVAGLPSRVAFHLTDQWGNGAEAKGFLVSAKGDTAASFASYKFGMGRFEITPRINENANVVFLLNDGSTVTQALPTVYESGYVMQLDETENNKLRITVHTNRATDDALVYLLAQTRQQVKRVQKMAFNNGRAVFLIDKKELGEGVSQFTVFNNEKRPVCERLYFIQPALRQAPSLQAVKVKYSKREKVELLLGSTITGRENMSLSVYQADELQPDSQANINEYLWLTSELNSPVEQPSFYFSDNSEAVQQTADLLMMTSGWRRFNWEQVLQPTPAVQHPLERSGQVITARVTDTRTYKPAENVQVYLSIPATPYKLFTAVTDSTGLAQFRVNHFYGPGELIVQTNSKVDSFYKVDILTPFAELPLKQALPPLVILSSLQQALVNNSISMQAQYIYHPENATSFLPPAIADTLPFYGRAIVSYDLDEYVRFTTMEEVLREYVREINVGVKGSGASLRIKLFNVNERELYTDDILVMVDGIPLFYPNKIFDLNPLKMKRIDILPVNYVLGDAVFHAVANFISYANPYPGLPLDRNAVTIDDEGLQVQRAFYAPVYATEDLRNSRLPDLRTTLLWMPNVNDRQPVFYTGDNKGRFIAVLQGIDAEGKAFSTSTSFSVD